MWEIERAHLCVLACTSKCGEAKMNGKAMWVRPSTWYICSLTYEWCLPVTFSISFSLTLCLSLSKGLQYCACCAHFHSPFNRCILIYLLNRFNAYFDRKIRRKTGRNTSLIYTYILYGITLKNVQPAPAICWSMRKPLNTVEL